MEPFHYVVTGEEMASFDRNTIEHFQVPALILMEQAALSVVEEIMTLFPDKKESILVLAGSGNNGGDAMAVARLLAQREYSVTLFYASSHPVEKLGEVPLLQYRMLEKMQVEIVTQLPERAYTVIVDGIFGVGLSRPVTGKTGELLKEVSSRQAYRIAIDVPSGVDSNTGKVKGSCFRADCTVTFSFLKLGLCLYPGADYAGHVRVKRIGITESSFENTLPRWRTLSAHPSVYMPYRPAFGHKGSFGKVLVIAGSKDSGGAAFLAGLGAFRCGCGMVCICTHSSQQSSLISLLPEAMLALYSHQDEAQRVLEERLSWADVIVLGPALGKEKIAQSLLNTVVDKSRHPLVIDADGLRLLADTPLGTRLLQKQSTQESRRELILTPHVAELSHLSGYSVKEVLDREKEVAEKTAVDYQAVIVQKDAKTLIVDSLRQGYLNLCGNSGMATAGSGDLLAGMIGALLAQGMNGLDAASLGVYLHGKAGDLAAKRKNEYSLMASDIGEALGELLKEGIRRE